MTMVSIRSFRRVYDQTDLALLQDLAQRAVAAFENAQLYRSALQAIRSRDDLLNIVSHDLRAPLSVIIGFVHMFIKDSQPSESITCETKHMEAIQRSAAQMSRLIEDLLATASIEAKHMPVKGRLWPVAELISEGLELMQPLATRKNVQLRSLPPSGIDPIFVDRDRIMQVFGNLIDNAIKFSPSGGTIAVTAEQLQNEVRFSVEDNGSGIPDDQLALVFDRFRQVPGTGSKGTGLGLFIVKGIVEAHGGKAWVESKVGVGSVFFFTLPVKLPGDQGRSA